MRKFLLTLTMFLLPVLALGQATAGYHRLNQVLARGNGVYATIVPYATVAVTSTATGLAGVIYADPGLTVRVPNSVVTADANGNYGYYFALEACMTEKIAYPNGGMLNYVNVCSNTSGGGSVFSFSAPAGNWPTWLVPSVATPTTTPVLTVTAGPIPYSALATGTSDTVIMNATGSTASPTAVSLPSGCTLGVNYSTSTHSWTCVASGGGTVTTTGSPAAGNIAIFSGASSITFGNFSGDATTSGSTVVTVIGVNGATVPLSALAVGTNSSRQLVASVLQGTDTKLMTAGTVSGTAVALCTDGNGGATTSGCTTPLINPMTTAGDIITGGVSGAPQRLGIGSNGQVLSTISGAPAWAGTVHTSGTNGYYTIAADGTITDYVNTGALNNNTPTTITLPHQITTTVMSAVCTDNGGRVQSGNDQPVGVNFVGLSAPFTTMFVNTPATGVTAYCIVVGY